MVKKTGSYIICDPDFISKRRANGDVLLVRLDDSEVYFTIDGYSADIWEKLSGGYSIEEAESELIKLHPKDESEIKDLMKSFIQDLLQNKMITLEKK